MGLPQKQTHSSVEQKREAQIDPQLYGQLIYDREQEFTMGKSLFNKWC